MKIFLYGPIFLGLLKEKRSSPLSFPSRQELHKRQELLALKIKIVVIVTGIILYSTMMSVAGSGANQ
jgi:hypothetical protein